MAAQGGGGRPDNLGAQLKAQKLTQQATVATAQADYSSAKLEFDVNDELGRKGLIPAITLKQAKSKADELARLLEIQRDCLTNGAEAATAQLAAQEAKVAQLRAQLEMKRRQVQALKVCAGMDGVLQRLGDATNPLQAGQQLAAGRWWAGWPIRPSSKPKSKSRKRRPRTFNWVRRQR